MLGQREGCHETGYRQKKSRIFDCGEEKKFNGIKLLYTIIFDYDELIYIVPHQRVYDLQQSSSALI